MLKWYDEHHGKVHGVPFSFVQDNFDQAKTTQDHIVVLKPKSFFDKYARMEPPSCVLEVGVFEGGSLLILATMWPDARFLGMDLRNQNDDLLSLIDRFGWADRIDIEYGVDQTDREKVLQLLDEKMPTPDLVIDDASHLYQPSRKTFETVFPRLAAGGKYILEDWGWAHWRSWPSFAHYEGQTPLSNMVWELVMCSATSPSIVEDVWANSEFAIIHKALTAPCSSEPVSLSSLYTCRGVDLDEHLIGALAERDAVSTKLEAVSLALGVASAERDTGLAERDTALAERDAALAERDAAIENFNRADRDRRARRSRLAYWIDYLDFRIHLFLSRASFAPKSFRERFAKAAQSRKRACYKDTNAGSS
ncbi:class I SAM-dependent methyltransferase [Aliiruegeria sabulilitoris]|uniref:class I SAM-dependent methyltransferase n=1 Tax=Aliiruegeria sabulilitoris TaxID=1510458 RepID=UPI0008319465|nr:class I SAM-dependent methyltransferase [Aliiruegeria sabulilitoris]NDR58431.1 hypothetical protein [Pseudoruegeria sp. M32A2M]